MLAVVEQNTPTKPGGDLLALMDVIFLVLIVFFYLILSMVRHQGIAVDLPRGMTAEPDQRTFVSVTVASGGRLFVDGTPVSVTELAPQLLSRRQSKGTLVIYVSARKDTKYQAVVSVLDLIRKTNVDAIYLETKTPEIPAA